ncbi:hypothetical protein FDV58_34380 [Bradyrhizobium elkanii]|uniref:Uncharacterized protein n=1 Tax=Bradyrhizobium elkanii TaxID=29448 RepID=A0A4U6RJS5_BRAEL|nr:hypothetical protein [Bradyrhizobium elkanii]TKV74078.1 hypothetical protein FDV58_34380 [Bradyrhizobium elkanii]
MSEVSRLCSIAIHWSEGDKLFGPDARHPPLDHRARAGIDTPDFGRQAVGRPQVVQQEQYKPPGDCLVPDPAAAPQ